MPISPLALNYVRAGTQSLAIAGPSITPITSRPNVTPESPNQASRLAPTIIAPVFHGADRKTARVSRMRARIPSIQDLSPPDPREAGKFPRLQGRAILSVAHQGYRRRHSPPARGPRVARRCSPRCAVLCQGAWLDEGPARGRMMRLSRRRDGRGQHLRGAAGRLEAGLRNTWWVVDYNVRVSTRWCAKGCGRNSNPCSAISAGTW